jgi:hypothetical protein
VNADIAQVTAKARLHEGARGVIEGMAGRFVQQPVDGVIACRVLNAVHFTHLGIE